MPKLTRDTVDLAEKVQYDKDSGEWSFSYDFLYDEEETNVHELAEHFVASHNVAVEITTAAASNGSRATLKFTGSVEKIGELLFDFDPSRDYDELTRGQMDAIVAHLQRRHG